jgi:hypothetical protein
VEDALQSMISGLTGLTAISSFIFASRISVVCSMVYGDILTTLTVQTLHIIQKQYNGESEKVIENIRNLILVSVTEA